MSMNCRVCESANMRSFQAETNLHFPGWRGLDQPSVFAFPKVMVCLDCGHAEFKVAERELRLIREGTAPPSGKKTAVA
jgi:hypothetical protein